MANTKTKPLAIGFTERGDAGLDLTWADKLDRVDGAVIITKNVNARFRKTLLDAAKDHELVLHAGCTGLGATKIEPNVPAPETQLANLAKLVEDGFELRRVVLRIDPILPTDGGIRRAAQVLDRACEMGLIGGQESARVRISLLDLYDHVKARLAAENIQMPYDSFHAPKERMVAVARMLAKHLPEGVVASTCAEPAFTEIARKQGAAVEAAGCLSLTDLEIMGIDASRAPMTRNGQDRHGCLCLTCKRELLTHREQCPHKCIYCYWR